MDYEDFISLDSDGSPIQFFSVQKATTYEQKSHELRLTHNDDIFSWQMGLFLGCQFNSSFTLQIFDPPNTTFDRVDAGSESFSVFAESDFRLADRFVLTTGFRYIEEKKTIEKAVDDGAGNFSIPAGTTGERTEDDVIWRLGLRYEVNDDLMTYFTYSTGFRRRLLTTGQHARCIAIGPGPRDADQL